MLVTGATRLSTPDHTLIGMVRPLRLGISIGHPYGSLGTLGGFVAPTGNSAKIGILSTATVLWPKIAAVGDYIHQPGPIDNQLFTGDSRVAQIAADIPLSRSRAHGVDAAYAELIPGIEALGNRIPDGLPGAGNRLGAPEGVSLQAGDRVAKVGRGSGYTVGRVTAVSIEGLTVHGLETARTWKGSSAIVEDVIGIEGDTEPFSGPADSGSVIYRIDDGTAVAL